jgi:hypothetical protein
MLGLSPYQSKVLASQRREAQSSLAPAGGLTEGEYPKNTVFVKGGVTITNYDHYADYKPQDKGDITGPKSYPSGGKEL